MKSTLKKRLEKWLRKQMRGREAAMAGDSTPANRLFDRGEWMGYQFTLNYLKRQKEE